MADEPTPPPPPGPPAQSNDDEKIRNAIKEYLAKEGQAIIKQAVSDALKESLNKGDMAVLIKDSVTKALNEPTVAAAIKQKAAAAATPPNTDKFNPKMIEVIKGVLASPYYHTIKGAKIEDIRADSKENGIPVTDVDNILKNLLSAGKIVESNPGCYRIAK